MRRTLGILGMVLAVVGVILCPGSLVGGWYARGVVNDAVTQMLPVVEKVLDEGADALDRAETLLGNANQRIDTARNRLRGVVEDNADGVAAVRDTVGNVVTSVVEPVRNVRNQIATLRSSIMLFTTFLNGMPSIFGLPDIPTDRLQAMDERAQQIDAQVAAIENAVTTTQENVTQTRDNINNALDTLQDELSNLSSAASVISVELENLQKNLPQLQGRINTAMTLLALLISLLALCGTALFVNLFHDAWREWEIAAGKWVKSHVTSTTTETRTHHDEGAEITTTTVTVTESKGKRLVDESLSATGS